MKRIQRYSIALTMAVLASPVLADVGEGYYGHHGMGWGGWFAGPVMMILFIGLIVVGVVITFRLLGVDVGAKSSDNALEILKARLAKGEIDKAEFEERRDALKD